MMFRIRKGTHVSHFHEQCPMWPTENFYQQEKPLWWGELCEQCTRLEKGVRTLFREKGPDTFSG